MNLLLLAHASPTVVPLYADALARAGLDGWHVHAFVEPGPGLSSKYAALANRLSLRADAPTLLDALLRHLGLPPRAAWGRVVLAPYSAGYALAWRLLEQAIDGLVCLDSGHTSKDPDGTASDQQLAPMVAFVERARRGEVLCWYGHSDVDPTYASTGEVAAELVRLAGPPAGLWHVERWPGGRAQDHREALGVDGPGFVARALGVLLASAESKKGEAARESTPLATSAGHEPNDGRVQGEGGGDVERGGAGALAADLPLRGLQRGDRGPAVLELQRRLAAAGFDPGGLDGVWGPRTQAAVERWQASRVTVPEGTGPSLGLRALAVALGELGQHEIPGPATSPRVAAYLAGAVRGGRPLGLAGDEPAWCAAFVGWCDHAAAHEGEQVPPWRAAVAEVWADAVAAGAARPASYRPAPGDLAVFRRAGGDPRRGGPGHVARVERVEGATWWGVGGNEGGVAHHGGEVMRTERRLDDSDLVGWVVRS